MSVRPESSRGWFWIATRPFVDVCLAFFVVWLAAAVFAGFQIFVDALRLLRVAYWGGWSAWRLFFDWLAWDVFILLLFSLGLAFMRRSARRFVAVLVFAFLLVGHYQVFPPPLLVGPSSGGLLRWLGWLDPLVRVAPTLILGLVGVLAFRSLFRRGDREKSSDAWDWPLLGLSPRRSRRLATLTLCLVIVVNVTSLRHSWPFSSSPAIRDGETRGTRSVVFVTNEIGASEVRSLLTRESRQVEWLRSADRLFVHRPTLQIRRAMVWQLVSGEPVASGPRSNWDVRWEEADSEDRLRPSPVVSFRSPLERAWLWDAAIPVNLQEGEFVTRARSSLNPIFSALSRDLSGQVEGSRVRFEEAFDRLEAQLFLNPGLQQSFHANHLIVDLPPYPGEFFRGGAEAYWERLRNLSEVLVRSPRYKDLERFVWVGLPNEQIVLEEARETDPVQLIHRATSAMLVWHIRGAALVGEEPSNDEKREWLDALLPGRPALSTECLGRLVWQVEKQDANDPCTESDPAGPQLTVFPTTPEEGVSESDLQNLLNLVRGRRPGADDALERFFVFDSAEGVHPFVSEGHNARPPDADEQWLLRLAGFEWVPFGGLGLVDRAPGRDVLGK